MNKEYEQRLSLFSKFIIERLEEEDCCVLPDEVSSIVLRVMIHYDELRIELTKRGLKSVK